MKVGTDGTLLGAWARGGNCILDVGTGTGLIALMMAQRFPEARVTGIDIDPEAIQQAAQNVAASPFAASVTVHRAAVQQFAEGCYDAIVCNPPFFIDALASPDRQRTLARHTHTLTYDALMKATARLLTDDGECSVVVPFDYRSRMEAAAVLAGLSPARVCAVRTTPTKSPRRYLLSFRKKPAMNVENTEIVIGSEAYQQLLKDFYLKY